MIPKRVKALLAVAIALVIMPVAWNNSTPFPGNLPAMVIALACEALLGLLIGSIILLAVTSMEIAGQAIGHLAGIDMAEAIDANAEENASILSSLLGWFAVGLLLTMGGHRQLMDCSLQSFERYPAGNVRPESFWLDELDDMFRHALVIGVRAAAPVGTALLMANLITGLIARTLPQLNVLAIGFNINVSAMFVALIISIGGLGWIFQTELAVWIESCQTIVDPSSVRLATR